DRWSTGQSRRSRRKRIGAERDSLSRDWSLFLCRCPDHLSGFLEYPPGLHVFCKTILPVLHHLAPSTLAVGVRKGPAEAFAFQIGKHGVGVFFAVGLTVCVVAFVWVAIKSDYKSSGEVSFPIWFFFHQMNAIIPSTFYSFHSK